MANVPIYDLTDVWNAGGTTFDAIKMSVDDQASASGSRLLELLVDSASKFRVDKAGNTTIAGTLGVTGAATLSSTLAVTGLGAFNAAIGRCGVSDLSIRIGAEARATASGDIGIGYRACGGTTAAESYTGLTNTCIGEYSGENLTSGTQNLIVGYRAARNMTTGNYNTILSAGQNTITTGSSNIIIGRQINVDSDTGNYQINIGNRYFHDRLELKNAASGAGDCILLREAANELAMRNGANAQTFRLYNTYTDASNYERGIFAWGSNVLKLGTQRAGTGVGRALELQTNGATRLAIGATGYLGIGTTDALARLHIADTLGARVFLHDTDSPETHNISELHSAVGTLTFATRSSTGVVLSTDYQAVKDTSGTDYHRWFTGGNNERLRINKTGDIGIGTTAPGRRLDVNDASGNCLRLTYNDADGSAANYADFLVSSSGDLTITPSGGDLTVTGQGTFTNGIGRCGASTDGVAIGPGAKARGFADVSLGVLAGGSKTADANYTGFGNTCIGLWTGENLTTGIGNVFIGDKVARNATTATTNVVIGAAAGNLVAQSTQNILIGALANLSNNTSQFIRYINIGNRYFNDRIKFQTTGWHEEGDCVLLREAANVLAMQNETNPQAFNLYNTYTNGTNYERGIFAWDSNVLKLGTAKAGSGVARALELQTDGTTRLRIASTGELSVLHARNTLAMNITNANASSAPTFNLGVGWPGYYDNWLVLNSPGGVVFGIRNDNATWHQYGVFALQTSSRLVFASGVNIEVSATTGTKIGISTAAKIAFWNKTPIVQPTTSHAEATFVENSGGTAVNDDSTFGGYTIGQVVKALQDVGLLA